jgi:hypothetical protein
MERLVDLKAGTFDSFGHHATPARVSPARKMRPVKINIKESLLYSVTIIDDSDPGDKQYLQML